MSAAGVLTASSLAAVAQAPSPVGQRLPIFTPLDVFALRRASDVQLSPDGRQLAYVQTTSDVQTDAPRRSIWVVNVATGRQRRLVAGAAASPRWSPDSQRLAYVAAVAGQSQVFVRRLAADTSVCISHLPAVPGHLAWAPDGRSLAFTMFVPAAPAGLGVVLLAPPPGAQWAAPPTVITGVQFRADGAASAAAGYTHLFVLSAEGGEARQLTFGAFNEGGQPAWTPDGRYLLFSANRHAGWERDPAANSEIFQVRVADGALTPLTSRLGPDQEPVVSPDGRFIAYTGYDERGRGLENVNLYVMDRDGTHVRVLSTALDRLVDRPQWAADSRSIYVSYDDLGMGQVGRFELTGRFHHEASGVDDGAFTVARSGTLGFALAAFDHPADVAVCPKAGAAPRQLTHLNADLLAPKTLAQVRPLVVTSSFDGLAVGAWCVTPPGYDPSRRYPTILSIHGGPFGNYGPQWSTDFQLYAAAGYIVLFANPRGSTSYGFDYFNYINHKFPSHDADDLLSVVDAAVAQGLADPNRLFVTGGSAGGLLTAWLVGKTPRFQAAAAEKPMINAVSQALLTEQYIGAGLFMFGQQPWEAAPAYWAHSPLALAGSVRTPTLLLVGELDQRTPVSEAAQFYSALQARGVPTALVVVPGAGHENLATHPSQHLAEVALKLAWFGRYGGIPTSASSAASSTH